MRTVGLKVLKNRLSEFVRMVSGGETVLVTDRDRVVAELRPPGGRGPLASDAMLAEAVRRGWRDRRQEVTLASYDARMRAAARRLRVPLLAM